jgi:hypothetical protein
VLSAYCLRRRQAASAPPPPAARQEEQQHEEQQLTAAAAAGYAKGNCAVYCIKRQCSYNTLHHPSTKGQGATGRKKRGRGTSDVSIAGCVSISYIHLHTKFFFVFVILWNFSVNIDRIFVWCVWCVVFLDSPSPDTRQMQRNAQTRNTQHATRNTQQQVFQKKNGIGFFVKKWVGRYIARRFFFLFSLS